MREPTSPFGLGFYILTWLSIGAILLGNPSPQEAVFGRLWILITVWIAIVVIHTRFFGETARGRRLAALGPKKLCLGCGYDLRATDDRCPECGKQLPATRDCVEALEMLAGPPIHPQPEEFDYEALTRWRTSELSRSNPSALELTETAPSTAMPPLPD
jgi:hypothetical protein